MIDVEQALLNPSAAFKQPEEVLGSKELSREQKIEILKRWEYDIRELQVADDESMTAPRPEPVSLESILRALRLLGAPADLEHSAPTKQGGH